MVGVAGTGNLAPPPPPAAVDARHPSAGASSSSSAADRTRLVVRVSTSDAAAAWKQVGLKAAAPSSKSKGKAAAVPYSGRPLSAGAPPTTSTAASTAVSTAVGTNSTAAAAAAGASAAAAAMPPTPAADASPPTPLAKRRAWPISASPAERYSWGKSLQKSLAHARAVAAPQEEGFGGAVELVAGRPADLGTLTLLLKRRLCELPPAELTPARRNLLAAIVCEQAEEPCRLAALEQHVQALVAKVGPHNKSAMLPAAYVELAAREALRSANRAAFEHALGVPAQRGHAVQEVIFPLVLPGEQVVLGALEASRGAALMGGARLLLLDWRRAGQHRFRCRCGSESMQVKQMTLEGLPFSLDVFSNLRGLANQPKKIVLGLINIPDLGERCGLVSPVLVCGDCSAETCMHDAFILQQLPGCLQDQYPAELRYATGTHHFHRRATRLLLSLRTDCGTPLEAFVRAADESLGQQYEAAALLWNYRLHEALQQPTDAAPDADAAPSVAPLDADAPVPSAAGTAPSAGASAAAMTALWVDGRARADQRRERFGVWPDTATLASPFERQLAQQSALRTAEMRSVAPPAGHVVSHISTDDNDQIAKRSNADNGGNPKKLRLTNSADPCLPPIIGAVLMPSARKDVWLPDADQTIAQFGAPATWSCDNFPTNSNVLQPLMPKTKLTADLIHMEKRTTSTLRATSRDHRRILATFAGKFLRMRQQGPHSVAAIEKALTTDGGIKLGSRVMIERGGGGKKVKYFFFKRTVGPTCGPRMPDSLVKQMHGNGCFKETFKKNLAKDWQPMSEIRKNVRAFYDGLVSMRALYAEALQMARGEKRRTVLGGDAEPGSASDAQAIRCATCGCLPQQHVPAQ